ncbi:biopolymer transporter ExbD [Shewanella sp. NFH-SH190041]|uniref:ExbD/TolR family protein n=1 Tax=Shewanella sp. NFH-SH190041 TaxID=2950245 RepID=UPI0021C32F1C|nr:biopolymer transporter ExbD [Shewanella sp. NFH-SH190041]BDM62974.1 biopolymer transporter ExbD [Shewanella sp. NFH-SH190041]
MISSRRPTDDEALSPDLTSLMDIIFIVMVFLLLSANIQVQTLDVAIPQAESATALNTPADTVLSVSVPAADGQWGLQQQAFNQWDDFAAAFTQAVQQSPQRPVVIASDKQASVEKLLKLFEFMQRHQIQATNIMMEGGRP